VLFHSLKYLRILYELYHYSKRGGRIDQIDVCHHTQNPIDYHHRLVSQVVGRQEHQKRSDHSEVYPDRRQYVGNLRTTV